MRATVAPAGHSPQDEIGAHAIDITHAWKRATAVALAGVDPWVLKKKKRFKISMTEL